uniref:SZT2 subunit of KICSTOR complex n=1 Tax=Sinocyclocheilus grahami TaxID=75366 RepID=A0A672N7A4_SINGR
MAHKARPNDACSDPPQPLLLQFFHVEEAEQVYLLMKEEYRISRNVRLSWFLNRLNQAVRPSPLSELLKSENELDVLSVLPKGGPPDSPSSSCPCLLVPSTHVTFLARRYRFIIELDLSPSTGIVDDSTGEMIFDEVFHALSRCLIGLAKPFKVPGTDHVFQPEIFITILAYSSIIGLSSHQVLVQGCQLDCMDLEQFLHQIYQQLRAVESSIADVLQQQHNQARDLSQRKLGVSMVTADVGLVSMVRQGILALQLLPPNSGAGIIIITDGVTSVPDVAVCETLLNQLRSGTIACSFVQVGGAYSYDCSFGYIPNVELMKFISMATFGSYLSMCPEPDSRGDEMNAYHRAFLTYSFLRTGESMNPEYYCFSQHRLFNEHLVSASGNPALVMRRKKHTEKEVHADLISVLSIRLREGYTIREINITKGSQLEVKLVLLWKHNMRVEYLAVASWPLNPVKRTTWVEVTIEGSYDILHDISCTMRKPITSPYRTSVIRRFWNTLQSINQTDQMLVHLQSFNSIPEHYTIPESTKNGVPLFYIPPGSTTPVLSLQHSGSKDSSQSQFASYWKPILSMDANFWQRWLHMHRIAIILEHDVPVPKHVHNAGSNGRFSTIQCRISHSALTSLLRDWSSFVLVEGYSYVKLIYSASELPPVSFYLVRLISKAPCMVLRLGFPIGTLAHSRNKIVDELQEQILRLRFPHRVQNKEATPKTKRKILGNASPSKSPPLPAAKPALSDRPCVVVLNKPLEKLLIRYEKLPSDFRTPFILNMEPFAQPPIMGAPLSMAASRTASSTMASLSRYFLHQRWVWAVQNGPGTAVSLHAVAHILSMLCDIRLSEGFHFAASGEGIVNMVAELPSADLNGEKHTCIVQYILFPPHSTSTKDSFSTDDDNDTEVEAIDVDTELSLVTECWVEPQSGAVCSSLEQQRHFHQLTYQEIPQAIFPRDLSCMTTMITFEYLSQLCQNKEQVCPLRDAPGELPAAAADDCIHAVPFQFDLMKLLPKCQQIELFFYTFSRGTTDASRSASCLPNDLLLSLFHGSLQNELSDREIPLTDGDHAAFMHRILERERDGHVAPFSLPVIKGDLAGGSFSNADLVDDEPAGAEQDCLSPHWKCYAKYISHQQILLTFLPATFTASEEKDGVQFLEPQKRDCHITFGRQTSQQSSADAARPRCPIYIYNCSLDSLKEQLVHPRSGRQPRDLMTHPHKHKELANYCSLLQEHYYQSYVKGVYRSLQQSHNVSSQDLLTAMDYCEESLQEIDITSFLQTLCGHVRVFRERHELHGSVNVSKSRNAPTTFIIGEEEDDGADRATLVSSSSIELEDVSEGESRGKVSAPTSLLDLDEPKSPKIPEFPLSLLQSQQKCEVYPDLHKIIQDKFMEIGAQYFKTVPSNPHYFFYCLPSSKKEVEGERRASEDCEVSEAELATEDENVSGCCIVTESDTDLEVEYQDCGNGRAEAGGQGAGEGESPSDSNTVNQDEDSFSILDGDSLLEVEGPQPEMPPLFVHLTCSVNMKSCHGSMPTQTLPTCLGEVITSLENAESLQSVDLNELSVTLDIFVLTLPLEIEVMTPDFHHNRYTSESSVSLNRSPGQPSSYRSDEELMANLDGLRGIRWLLEDEIVSALRHSSVISSSTLQKVSEHVCRSSGRPQCHCELVPLQFVFGPEQSLEKFQEEFKRLSLPGYLLNAEQKRSVRVILCLFGMAPRGGVHLQSASFWRAHKSELASLGILIKFILFILSGFEFLLLSGSGKLRPSRVQSVVSSQGSLDSDMLGYDGGSSDSECDGPTMNEQERQTPLMPDFWLIIRIHQDRVEVFSHARYCSRDTLSYQPRDYLAATMQFIPGYFACDVVWSTVIYIHPRLKMGPNMGVSRAIQALRSVLNAFCVVNRKNMFVYQERTTKSVFYLRPDVMCVMFYASRSSLEGSRPVGLVDKHILLQVHGVGTAGPEISDELVKVLRKRLDEATLDIITVMLVRNCKLTPADVECRLSIACIALSFVDAKGCALQVPAQDGSGPALRGDVSSISLQPDQFEALTTVVSQSAAVCVRFDVWEQGNISPLQLTDQLRAALRHALCDILMEMRVLPNPLCLDTFSHGLKSSPSPISLSSVPSSTPTTGTSTPESTTPTGKTTRRSFWEMLSKPETSELGGPKTTDDIVPERVEDSRVSRRRHKTESVKQQWNHEKAMAVEQEQVQRHAVQLEEGDTGTLQPIYQTTYLPWVTFMNRLGCPSIQHCSAEASHHFLMPSILTETVNLVGSLAGDTAVKVFERTRCGDIYVPLSIIQHISQPPGTTRSFILIGRNFSQWHCSTEQGASYVHLRIMLSLITHSLFFLFYVILLCFQVTLYTYNWSVDLGVSLNQGLVRLVQWQNARAHVVSCLLSQKMGLFHHYCFSDTPTHEDLKQEPNPFLSSTIEADALLRSPVPPAVSKDQGRMGSSTRALPPLAFPGELVPFDEALRDVNTVRPLSSQDGPDIVARHGAQLLEVKAAERRELERQMKIENLFVTWQQRSAQSNMPISVADLDTLKQSSRLVHYCATPLLFDPVFRKRVQEEQLPHDSTASGRDRSYSMDSADMLPSRLKEEPWLQEISSMFLQQYVQYLQSMGFILVQVRPQSPARSSLSTEGRSSFSSFSYNKQKSEDSPKVLYLLIHIQPFSHTPGCYFCVKQFALECSRIPMGQTVNSQLSMLFTEECDKVRDLMHVHSFSYDFHLRVVHQYLVGCHMTLRQGYQLTAFLEDFIAHHPDIPKFGRNHVFQGSFSISTGMITAHQLYNYITDHAGTYGMKPLRMSKSAVTTDNKKGAPSADLHDSGSFKDLEGLRHHDDFDVSLLVCHNAAPFEEQSEGERHLLRLRFYVIMTSQRELFPRLTADMRRFKNPESDPMESLLHADADTDDSQGLFYLCPLFPLLSSEVLSARRQIQSSVEQAMGHCRRDNLWRRLFHGEHLALDKLKLSKLAFGELEELLDAVQSRSVSEIDPQLDCFLNMSPAWYQSLIKVLLSRFPQNCRHFKDDGGGIQYLAVLNQKFTDCFVLVFLDTQAGKTSLKVVFRELLPAQTQSSSSPPPQLVSMYHHLESVINTACYNLWTGLL